MPASQAQFAFGNVSDAAALALHPEQAVEPGLWDEMREADGRLREPWQRFASWLRLGSAGGQPCDPRDDLDRRAAQVAEQIRLDGVTHNVFSEDGAASRAWSLELLPLLVTPADWAALEAGVVQRAALLEQLLGDVYGPQRLLHEGLLPPALVLRHGGYLRALRGVEPAGGQRLHIVAFDLARGDDGRWWVMGQRTQGPSGLGYVLHNRLVIARQFPDAFRELQVQHIASSYRRLLDTLDIGAREVARRLGHAAPRIVLLTPGPFSETYFEHAYLARYLGLPLAEGDDLLVRHQRLYLKTVEGLEPVHGLLRRLDDEWCDPLELRAASTLGVPGLVQVLRAGHLVLANALGSGFLESPALQGFLPGIAERLNGEGLLLPTLPTWWCGEAAAWADVRGALDGKLLRSTYPRRGQRRDDGRSIEQRVADDADAWTLQSRQRFSRAPIWQQGRTMPRPALLRVYAMADPAGRWHVLPGGMTRVAGPGPRTPGAPGVAPQGGPPAWGGPAPAGDDGSVSMQRGGSSLDTWVLTEGAVEQFSMLPRRLQVDDLVQRERPVASRTGENLFWLGRYTERTEQLVRLARATLQLIDTDSDADPAVQLAVSALAVKTGLAPWGVPTLARAPHLFERAVLLGLGRGSAQGGSSVANNLAALQRCSQSLRERLSSEQWGLIRRMEEGFALAIAAQAPRPDDDAAVDDAADAAPPMARVLVALDALALQLAAVTGAQTDRMTRDHGWRLLAVGRLLERLVGLTDRLGIFLEHGALGSAAGIDLLLELFDSTITYRARYQRREDLLALADLLVLDNTNPRAFAGVLRRLRTELSKLPGDEAARAALLARLPAQGSGIELESLRGMGDDMLARRLAELAASLGAAAAAISDAIGARYFTLAHQRSHRV
jgi:uncharacterized circularly permuted ATP-grasp superfamily protein/uncharacterized alpha-E superfamily protein